MKRNDLEFRLQCVVVDYLTRAVPDLVWTAFPAGEARTERTGARLKRAGLKPGWPYLIAILPGGTFLGLELKAEGGRLSEHQSSVRSQIAGRGGYYFVIRSLDDVRETLAMLNVPTRERAAA